MNIPNKLTILRVAFIPAFMVALYLIPDIWGPITAAALFIIAAITDKIDGNLARRLNQITNLGKFLDPLADKLLIFSALFCLVDFKIISVFTAMVIVIREMMVMALRFLALEKNGTVIAADFLGKLKTVVQMVTVPTFLLDDIVLRLIFPQIKTGSHYLGYPVWIITLVITVVSGIDYFMKNRGVLKK